MTEGEGGGKGKEECGIKRKKWNKEEWRVITSTEKEGEGEEGEGRGRERGRVESEEVHQGQKVHLL